MAKLESVEGIGAKYAAILRKVGVRSTDDLLRKGSTYTGRQKLAQAAGVSDKLILEWINRVDLIRIKGVGEEYADLLEEAGVDTVVELAQHNPENLYQKILEVNQAKKLVRQLPTSAQVADWIVQAKKLPRLLNY